MPASISIDSPLSLLPGIGPVRAAALTEAGVAGIRDLLLCLPVSYQDWRVRERVSDLSSRLGEEVCVSGRLDQIRTIRTRRRGFSIVQGRISDDSGFCRCVWFNRPYLANQVENGGMYRLLGRVVEGRKTLELRNPDLQRVPDSTDGHECEPGRVVPVYRRIGPLGPAGVRTLVRHALERVDLDMVADDLPRELAKKRGLPSLSDALRSIHAPPHDADAASLERAREAARQRLVYRDLLQLQLGLAAHRTRVIATLKPHRYQIDSKLEELVSGLFPFPLTPAQQRAAGEILEDLDRNRPMLRLLQGDVGCGKTAVAAMALAVAAQSGLQAAFMAPTELLAEQQYESLKGFLGDFFEVVLLTRSSSSEQTKAALANGTLSIAVGTHALIQDSVEFARLALVIVDEQHRFGVAQRRALGLKGSCPDLLVMTATPIPRSLALITHGDLDVSVIDEMPPGRIKVETTLVAASRRQVVRQEIRQTVGQGGQAFVVFPFIETSDRVEAEALEGLGRDYISRLTGIVCATVSGRCSVEDRRRIMAAFMAGKVEVLLATTVVEVGVDVPNASLMVIESAERFGLAQLHQIRGRVGRGTRHSRCLAVHGKLSEDAEARLGIFARSQDGFEIAEADLGLRGPGELLGTRQAGSLDLTALRLPDDLALVAAAKQDAVLCMGALDRPGFEELRALVERESRTEPALAGG